MNPNTTPPNHHRRPPDRRQPDPAAAFIVGAVFGALVLTLLQALVAQ